MKLYKLTRHHCDTDCGADCCVQYAATNVVLVRAPDEVAARIQAQASYVDEGPTVWLTTQPCGAHVTCIEVPVDGPIETIIVDGTDG